MPHPNIHLYLLTLLALLIPHASQAITPVSGEYDCAAHNATANLAALEQGGDCLPYLRQNPQAYDVCKTTVCYIFIREEPFIIFDTDVFTADPSSYPLQRPFRCGSPTDLHPSLRGITFEVHKLTSSRGLYCMWSGHATQCEFNALVDFTEVMAAEGYQFALSGALLETPQRQCHHNPSAPLIDDPMIIIGHNPGDKSIAKNPIDSLTRPFQLGAWAIFGIIILTFAIVAFAIAVRFHVFRGRSLITAFFIFTGERDEALAYENHVRELKSTSARSHKSFDSAPVSFASSNFSDVPPRPIAHSPSSQENDSFATKYGLSMTLFRIALVSFFAIFALFYEVAVVNFLFQQRNAELSKTVRSLSPEELQSYSILKNSALEHTWNATVNPLGSKYNGSDNSAIPWRRCNTGLDCINWAADPNHPVQFDVTYGVVGKYLIRQASDCKTLSIFETQDVLYHFNAGWLYNGRVDEEVRKQIDRELIALRINGTIRRLVDDEVGDFECKPEVQTDIGPLIILIPCGLFVVPPLFCSVLVLFLWKKKRNHSHTFSHPQVPDEVYAPRTLQGSILKYPFPKLGNANGGKNRRESLDGSTDVWV